MSNGSRLTGQRARRRCCAVIGAATILVLGVAGCTSNARRAATATPTQTSTRTAPINSSSSTTKTPIHTAWGGTVVTGQAVHAVPLLSAGGSLYAADTHRLYRIHAATNEIAAQVVVAHLSYLSDAVISDGVLWLSPTDQSSGHEVLTGLDPLTLAPKATVALPVSSAEHLPATSLTGPSSTGRLYLGLGNTIYVIDARARRVVDQIAATGGQLEDIALSADNTQLYAAVDHGNIELSRIEVFQPSSGALLRSIIIDGRVGNNIGLVVSTGGLWTHTGGGMADHLGFLAADSLSPATPSGYADIQERPLTITVSGGTVWIGSENIVACGDPKTGHERDSMHLPTRDGSTESLENLAAVDGHLYGSYNDPSGALLVQLTPPPICAG